MFILYVLLAIIAYYLYRIYRQKEDEREAVASEKFESEWKKKKDEEFKEFPHLIGKVDYSWLELFGKLYVEKNISHLNAAYLIYLKEANNTKLDMEVDHLFDSLWNLTEELLEHLEEYHESTKHEYEIVITTFWQLVSQETEAFVGKDIRFIERALQSDPFTNIEKIPFWFPKKDIHPDKEVSFRGDNDNFPRESKGSEQIHARITV